MNCQENVNPANIKIKVIGKVGDRNTGVRLFENNFVRIGKELVYAKSLGLTKEDRAAINLYHKQDQFETHYVKRVKFQ